MRAEELQLDDWVLYDGKPNQVRSLSDDNGCRLSMRLHSVLTYDTKPIPLTPEILELNGVEYVHQLQHILRDCGMGVDITKVEESK